MREPTSKPNEPFTEPDTGRAQADRPPTLPETPPTSLFGRIGQSLRNTGREAVAVVLGRLLDRPAPPEAQPPDDETTPPETSRRVGMLHTVTEHLRGAADSYVAAKLDEIEARVDAKLDAIEGRIDRKIVELHRQLAEMRDRELRHRLRVLKITLIFTALVALLSLVYKWVSIHWLA